MEEKRWRDGIPCFKNSDVLSKQEINTFCTENIASYMQDEGYTIHGLLLDSKPTQIIAEKDGKQYYVIVAGEVYPYKGKISFSLKKRFSAFCKKQGTIPMFASVGIMSNDPERAAAKLALKNDGYLISYNGSEKISEEFKINSSEDFKAFWAEKIIEAYSNASFEELYEMFDKNIQFHSQWVLEPTIGKKDLINSFERRSKVLKSSDSKIDGSVVVITQPFNKKSNVKVLSKPGDICVLLCQTMEKESNYIFISFDINKENKITKICLNDPSLYEFKPYYTYE